MAPICEALESILGESTAMREVRRAIETVARDDRPVLIEGETGTGKELVARAIHGVSNRRAHRLIAINCAAIPESMFEAELFGHARGAFTSAEAVRTGLVEAANRGTLFLDEIGSMPLTQQAKLLRVLDTREVRRIGENDGRKVDVKFVAASNADLRAMARTGAFRDDLLFRLSVHKIKLSPLRDRREDIPILISHFLSEYGGRAAAQYSGTGRELSRPALDALSSYEYPGNVRELQHLITRIVAATDGHVIELSHLPEECRSNGDPNSPTESIRAAFGISRERFVDTLRRHSGRVGAAAKELGVSRTTMWRLARKFALQPCRDRQSG